ncbi:uncharacterized protein LOC141628731 [Silene latifolia]|uniref:uncharacterized protein LOC141628731 n=1 Tax=Silene latifolia TaxID=37657 RepID=UPI003D76E636
MASTSHTIRKNFKYLNCWASSPYFLSHVKNGWDRTCYGSYISILFQKLKGLKATLKTLHGDEFTHLTFRVKMAKQELFSCQCKLHDSPLETTLVTQEKELSSTYEFLKKAELQFLQQRAKISDRKANNTVGCISDMDGHQCQGRQAVASGFLAYYKQLLGESGPVQDLPSDLFSSNTVPEHLYPDLIKPISNQDIINALKTIDRNKSPRIDGYSSGFFLDAWEVVGVDFLSVVHEFFSKGKLPKAANAT